MAAAVARQSSLFSRAGTPPTCITINTSARGTPTAVPNKHIPLCSPETPPALSLDTLPVASPERDAVDTATTFPLYPPDSFRKIVDSPPVYLLDADTMAAAIHYCSAQPLPESSLVFPWLHGATEASSSQLAFFAARRRFLRNTPKGGWAVTVVKAGRDLSPAKLKGAVLAEELIYCPDEGAAQGPQFLQNGPRDGISIRNFEMQIAKLASVSDIVVYGDEETTEKRVLNVAKRISNAQRIFAESQGLGPKKHFFTTFVLTDSFSVVEKKYPELIAIDSAGLMTENVLDFFLWERKEMNAMSEATEISKNVFLGPPPEYLMTQNPDLTSLPYDLYIECTDSGTFPALSLLDGMLGELSDPIRRLLLMMEIPGSGALAMQELSQQEIKGLLRVCRFIWQIAHGSEHEGVRDWEAVHSRQDADTRPIEEGHRHRKPQRVLIMCADGYTENSLLGLAYLMFIDCIPAHEAWIRLHKAKGRDFFAYPADVHLLRFLQSTILEESPNFSKGSIASPEPSWFGRMDGSLPNRILPYMYLGNLRHANNPDLLLEMGITQIISVGEEVTWSENRRRQWSKDRILRLRNVQDNGLDSLTDEFDRCLEFLRRGKAEGTATLVHCRVGVSRSATICIAEVMKELGLSFPRAYCYVRARRLNVIIQPSLRFVYELLKWEALLQQRRGQPIRRELEWASIAREIALMNKPYAKQC